MSSLFGRKSSVPTVPTSTVKSNNINSNSNQNNTADTPETNQHIPQPVAAHVGGAVQGQGQGQGQSSFDLLSSGYQLPPIPRQQQHQLSLTSSAPSMNTGVLHSTDLTENLKHMRLQNQNPLNNSLAVNQNQSIQQS